MKERLLALLAALLLATVSQPTVAPALQQLPAVIVAPDADCQGGELCSR